jgi:hypothetical protein
MIVNGRRSGWAWPGFLTADREGRGFSPAVTGRSSLLLGLAPRAVCLEQWRGARDPAESGGRVFGRAEALPFRSPRKNHGTW